MDDFLTKAFNAFLTVASVISSPEADFAAYNHTQNLISTLFTRTSASLPRPDPALGGTVTTIFPTFSVAHVEPLDEDHEMMTVHGTLTLKWVDLRATWRPSEHGDVSVINRPLRSFPFRNKPWVPRFFFTVARGFDRKVNSALTAFNGMLSINANGTMIFTSIQSLRVGCDFNFAAFPYDRQRCAFAMYTPYSAQELLINTDHEAIRVDRGDTSMNTMQGLGGVENARVQAHDFVLSNGRAFTHFVSASALPEELPLAQLNDDHDKDASIFDPSTRAIVYFEMDWDRLGGRYSLSIGVPLACTSVLLHSAALCLLSSPRAFFSSLLVSIFLLVLQMSAASSSLPSDYDGTPLLVVSMYVVFMQSILLGLGQFLILFYLPEESPPSRKGFVDELLDGKVSRGLWEKVLLFSSLILTLLVVYWTLVKQSWESHL